LKSSENSQQLIWSNDHRVLVCQCVSVVAAVVVEAVTMIMLAINWLHISTIDLRSCSVLSGRSILGFILWRCVGRSCNGVQKWMKTWIHCSP